MVRFRTRLHATPASAHTIADRTRAVRLMELPQLLVFRKRVRVAEVVPLDPQMATSDFIEGLHDLFVKNWRSEPGGVCQKLEIEVNDYPTYIPRDRRMPGPGLEIRQVGRTHFAQHGGEL